MGKGESEAESPLDSGGRPSLPPPACAGPRFLPGAPSPAGLSGSEHRREAALRLEARSWPEGERTFLSMPGTEVGLGPSAPLAHALLVVSEALPIVFDAVLPIEGPGPGLALPVGKARPPPGNRDGCRASFLLVDRPPDGGAALLGIGLSGAGVPEKHPCQG